MRQMQNQGDRTAGYIGMTISAVDHLQAQRVRRLGRQAIDQFRAKYDAVIESTTL